jgi:hypothetical protein
MSNTGALIDLAQYGTIPIFTQWQGYAFVTFEKMNKIRCYRLDHEKELSQAHDRSGCKTREKDKISKQGGYNNRPAILNS